MEGNDNLDSFFKSKLEDGQANVPAGSWQSISQKVAAEKNQKNRGFIIPIPLFWIAASFLMGSVAGAVSFYAYDLKNENKQLRAQMFNNESFHSSNNNSGVSKPSQSFNNVSLNTSTGFIEKLKSKYNFNELLSRPEKLSSNQAGNYSRGRFANNNVNGKSGDMHTETEGFFSGASVNENQNQIIPHTVSNSHTLLALISQSHYLSENVNGTEREKLNKPDSLIAKPDTILKTAKEAKDEQENKIKKAVRVFGFPISAGIYVTPEMASRSINFSEESDPELIKYKQKDERKFGFSAGLNLDIHLPKNFFIRTGINYWNVGEKNTVLLKHTEYDTTTNTITSSKSTSTIINNSDPVFSFPPNSDDSSGNLPPITYTPGANKTLMVTSSDITTTKTQITESASQFSSTVSNNYHYLGIPLLVGMKMSNKKLSFGLFSGLITNVLLSPSSSVYYIYYDPELPEKFVQSKRELSRFLLLYSGGLDFDYKIAKNWTVSISPNIKYSVTSIYNNATVKQLPYSFGVQFGVKCQIGK